MGSSILVCFLYAAKPSLRDWRLSAMGMLTARKSPVFATAPAIKYHALDAAQRDRHRNSTLAILAKSPSRMA